MSISAGYAYSHPESPFLQPTRLPGIHSAMQLRQTIEAMQLYMPTAIINLLVDLMRRSNVFLSVTAITAIILISGCVEFQNAFGQGALTVTRKITDEGARDVLVIKEAGSIPKSPLLPDKPVIFSFIVENADKAQKIGNLYVDLFNAPLFKAQDKSPCNSASTARLCQPQDCKESKKCSLLSGEERVINFDLLSPTESEIARIKTDTELSYRVLYSFTGRLLYSIPVVNQEEIKTKQRQGQAVALSEQVFRSSGPVQIDVQLFGTPYLLSGFSGTFIFNIRNVGNGNIANSVIPKNKFFIDFPADILDSGTALVAPGEVEFKMVTNAFVPGSKFQCEPKPPVMRCSNSEPIELFRGETKNTLRFTVSKVANIKEPFRTFVINSWVDYDYELRRSLPVTIRPFEGSK